MFCCAVCVRYGVYLLLCCLCAVRCVSVAVLFVCGTVVSVAVLFVCSTVCICCCAVCVRYGVYLRVNTVQSFTHSASVYTF